MKPNSQIGRFVRRLVQTTCLRKVAPILVLLGACNLAVAQPAPPTLSSPGSATSPGPTIANLTPTFSWGASAGATGYGLYIRDQTTGTLIYDNDFVPNSTTLALPSGYLVNGHQYRWNMRAKNASGWGNYTAGNLYFQSPTAAPNPPTLSSPGTSSSPGPTIANLTPTFSWGASAGATGYGLYIRDQTTGTLIYDNDNVPNGTTLALPSGYLVNGHQYRWNMRAKNASGWGNYTAGYLYFQTPSPVPDPPTLSSPGTSGSPGPTIANLTPTFSWGASAGATGYGLYIRDQTTATLIYDNDNVPNGTTLALPSGYLVNGHQYRWNMRAKNASGWGDYTAGYLYFQSPMAVPNPPTLGSPGTSSSPGPTIANLTPTFSWGASAGATGYGLYIRDQTTGTLIYDNDNVPNGTTLALPSGYLVNGHQYRWNMRAKNASGWGDYTAGYLYFQTEQPPVGPPTITSPGDPSSPGPVLSTLAPQFTWNTESGATGYGLYIRDLTTDTLVFNNDGGVKTGTSFNLPSGYLVAGHSFRWAMTSFTGANESAQSSYRYFQTSLDVPTGDGFDYPIGSRVRYTEVNDGDGWYVAQAFGEWNSDFSKYHLGEDWNAESGGNTDCGLPVYSVANGTIVYAGIASGWGKVLIIRHSLSDGTQVESLYGHMATFTKTSGNAARGELIGTIGDGSDGGVTYPCHLHLEIRLASCPHWGQPGPGYSTTQAPTGWVDPWDFIGDHRSTTTTLPPTITSPGDISSPGPVLTTLTPQFTWNVASGATGYGLYIRDLTTDTLVFNNTGGVKTGTSFNLPPGYLVAGHSYRWAMTSFNGASESAQSSYRFFQTEQPIAPPPTITSPGDISSPGPVLATLTPQFTWNTASGATGYGLYIRDLTTDTLVFNNNGGVKTGTSFNLPSGYLVAGHSYRWAMTSFTGASESAQSSYRFFQTTPETGTLPLGIDVSTYQGVVTWSQVNNPGSKAFALIRATAGKNTTDTRFAQNAVDAKAAGLLVGAYHFAYPEYFTAHEEAQKFLSVAGAYVGAGCLPPALDIEDSPVEDSYPYRMGNAALSQWIRDWCSEVEQVAGIKPMIYATRYYARNYFENDLSQYPYWVVTDSGSPDSNPGDMGIWTSWRFQQYRYGESGGTCSGVIGPVDLDSFNGDLTALRAITNRATPTCIAMLLTPSSGATVMAPPTFTWSFSGTCSAKVYVATNPIPEQIAVFSNVFSAGLNSFTPSASRWSSAVAYLGSSPVYYWTIGNADTSLQDTYAAWRPFTTMPIFTGGGGGGLQPPSNGQFRFEITAPNQMQITVQASDDLVNWSDIGTSNIVNGKTMFTDPNAGTHTKRFYRSKP